MQNKTSVKNLKPHKTVCICIRTIMVSIQSNNNIKYGLIVDNNRISGKIFE